ncbi:MAG TPA: response regulator [Trebonia sp.]
MSAEPAGGEPAVTRIAAVHLRSRVTVTGVIRLAAAETIGTGPALRCVLADGSGQIDLLFLGREALTGLEPGRRCTVTGRACLYEGRLVIWNPRYELEPPGPPADPDGDGGGVDGQVLTNGRVLVIGDDPGLCRVIEVNLAARGYQVAAASSAAAADFPVGRGPDLVIADLGAARADQMDIVAAIRDRVRDVPILAVSARGSEDVRHAAIAVGADDFLPKPFPIVTLLSRVTEHTSGRDGGRAAAGDNEP